MSESLILYVVYEKPTDYPDLYVIRKFISDIPDEIVGLGETLEKVRQYLPKGVVNIGRNDEDDPVIIEVWI